MINLIVVEDENKQKENLENLINRVMQKAQVNCKITFLNNGLQLLEKGTNNFDIVILDIDLPHMNGIDVAKKIREVNNDIIIILMAETNQYAIEGYEVNALAYLLKDSLEMTLENIINNAVKIINKKDSLKVILELEDAVRFISPSDIYYFEVDDHLCYIHTITEVISYRQSLKYYEDLLKDHGFIRSNSCYLINLKYVEKVDNKDLWINNNKLQISRSKYKEVVTAIKNYYINP